MSLYMCLYGILLWVATDSFISQADILEACTWQEKNFLQQANFHFGCIRAVSFNHLVSDTFYIL